MENEKKLLEIIDLYTFFDTKRGTVKRMEQWIIVPSSLMTRMSSPGFTIFTSAMPPVLSVT